MLIGTLSRIPTNFIGISRLPQCRLNSGGDFQFRAHLQVIGILKGV